MPRPATSTRWLLKLCCYAVAGGLLYWVVTANAEHRRDRLSGYSPSHGSQAASIWAAGYLS